MALKRSPIPRNERGVAREMRAMKDRGFSKVAILRQWRGYKPHFLNRALADPSITEENLQARRVAQQAREVERWVRENPPARPTERQELPEPNLTLCEAVNWLATGATVYAETLRKRPLDQTSRADMLLWALIEIARQDLEEAAAEDDLWLFGQKETGSGEPSGTDERLPAAAFLARDPKLAAKLDLANDAITIGSTLYRSVWARRKNLLELWPASTSGVSDNADQDAAVEPPDKPDERKPLKADTDNEYARRVEEFRATKDRHPSWKEDVQWRTDHGVTRNRLRELREANLTDEEKKGGAPLNS